MKRLDKYVVRELIVPFLIGTVAVVLMFQANTYMFYAKNFDLQNVPTSAVFQVIYFRTPEFLNMTLPVGMSLAASLAMSRLARESELTAMRAAGVRILRVIAPVVVFGLFVAVGDFFLIEKVMPGASRRSNQVAREVGIEGSLPSITENVPLKLGKYAAFLGSVQRVEGNGLDVTDVLLVQRPEPNVWEVINAADASYRDGQWTFRGAYLRRYEKESMTQFRPEKDFVVNEEILVESFGTPSVPEEKTLAELQEKIALTRSMGRDTRRDEVKYHVKFAVPASVVVFALVAPLFSILFARSGGFVGVLISIVMVLLYYNGFIISTDILGKYEFMPPWLAAWLTNILFAILGLLAIRRLE
ncbi:MAG TPA: LptF/LptG family permease [Fimbriimonas sp.]